MSGKKTKQEISTVNNQLGYGEDVYQRGSSPNNASMAFGTDNQFDTNDNMLRQEAVDV